MRIGLRIALGALAALALGTVGILLASSSSARPATSPAPAVTILYGSAPDFLDPQESYTSQGDEALWVSYLGLYSYAHQNGQRGSVVIPALADGEPRISDGGKTYTVTLRPHLRYSNGAAVKASDFTYALERALKLNWGGDSFYTGYIVGAAAYAKGASTTISGITTNDASRTITIHLLSPFGAFENVLAFPSSGLVPAGTAMRNLTNDPPPGVGPYMITHVVPNRSWVGAINPRYAKEAIPGIPVAHAVIHARVEANTAAAAENVLNNSADLLDTADSVAPQLLAQIKARAAGRYGTTRLQETDYVFLNTKARPFNSQLVREAVTYALDRRVLSRLDSGNLVPGCYFLPPGVIGHPTAACPYGDPAAAPQLAKAKQLVARSGEAGAKVTVWSQQRAPHAQFMTYYASVLQQLGFAVTIKPVADADYFPTVGNLSLNAQTGFDDWLQDFPTPGDFYANNFDVAELQPTSNEDLSQVDDPKIQRTLRTLDAIPSTELGRHAAQWEALDGYTARKAYALVIGYPLAPVFASERIDYKALVVQPSYGWDWTSIRLK